MGADDDLHGFDEESLLAALRAPGSSDELAHEERYVAAFREAGAPRHSRGRTGVGGRVPSRRGGAVRRLGAGTALAVAVGVSFGGVAAAYTGDLPDPLQEFAHRVLGPVGAPPVDKAPRRAAAPRSPAAPTSESATPSPSESVAVTTPPASASPTSEPSKKSKPSKGSTGRPEADPTTTASPDPSATPSAAAAPTSTPEITPSPSVTPSGSPSPSEPPSASPPPPVAAAVTIALSAHRVDVGQTASIRGAVTAGDGSPVPEAQVALQRRGPDGWERIATATSDDSGSVTFESAPVTQTLVLRLRSASVTSDPWLVLMHPLLSLSSQIAGSSGEPDDSAETVVISVSAAGGQTGDRVILVTRKGGRSVTVGEGVLNSDGSVDFGVIQSKRRASYVVVLQRTSAHSASRDTIRVTLPADGS